MPCPTNSRTTEKPFCSTQLCTAWPTSPSRLPARILSIARSRDSRVTSSSFCTSRSEEHTSELQSHLNLVCRLLLEKKKNKHENCRHQSPTAFRMHRSLPPF